jgi:hypothetical protein
MSDSTIFNSQQRLDLAALIKANDTDDCTEEIRSKKQSVLIKNDVKPINNHISELGCKYDFIINNNSDLQNLFISIDNLFNLHEINKNESETRGNPECFYKTTNKNNHHC